MPEVPSTHRRIFEILEEIPRDVKTVIDVGCGRGVMGALLRIYRDPEYVLGIDNFQPYLDFCAKHRFYNELLKLDLREGLEKINDRKFDLGLAIEVIEHLDRRTGADLVSWFNSHCDTAIITTPTSFFDQPAFDSNEDQRHVSLWTAGEFKSLGWKVRRRSSGMYTLLLVGLGRAAGTTLAVRKNWTQHPPRRFRYES